jgi:hypothetical protein
VQDSIGMEAGFIIIDVLEGDNYYKRLSSSSL